MLEGLRPMLARSAVPAAAAIASIGMLLRPVYRGEVVGADEPLEARGLGRERLPIRSRRGVIFATGGFGPDPDLAREFLCGPILGSMLSLANRGDFVRIAVVAGARLGNMSEAWFAPIVLDQTPVPASGTCRLPGDSMLVVTRYEDRVVDEKTTYNEMTRAFSAWDPSPAGYRNLPIVMLYDESASERCRIMSQDAPVAEGGGNRYRVCRAASRTSYAAPPGKELAERIAERLDAHRALLPGARLDAGFERRLRATVARFDRMAGTDVDEDFGPARPRPRGRARARRVQMPDRTPRCARFAGRGRTF